MKPRKKKSSGRILKERWEKGHKEVAPLGQPSGKFDYLVKYSPPPKAEPVIPTGWDDQRPPETPPVLPCYKKAMKWLKDHDEPFPSPSPASVPVPQFYMFSSVSNYDEEFPELTSFADKTGTTSHQPKVPNPTTREADGSTKKVSPAEAVLNWQTENMVAQNKALKRIDHKLTQVDTKVSQMDQSLINLKNVITKLNERIQLTHETLMSYIRDRSTPQSLFLAKEAEMKSLKNQLASLQSQLQQRQQATMVDTTPWMFSTLPKAPQPLPLAAPSVEPSILRLRRILEEEDKIKKEADHKGKKKQDEPKASDQFMVQQTPLNPLTRIIHQQCLDQLPQISLNEQVQPSEEEASSSDESIPEWSTEASSQTDPEDIETHPPHFMAQTKTSGQGETFVVDNDDEEMSTMPPSKEAPPGPT